MVYVANASPELDAMSRYPSIIAVCVVMSALASIVVCTRLKVRQGMKTLKADDWMALVAMIMGITYSVLCIVQTKYGLGLKPAIRPKANIAIYSKVNYAGRPIYQMGISCFKLALLISYLRLVQDTQFRLYRMVVWFAFAFVFLAHLGCTLSLIFACQPVQKSWIPSTPGTCIPDGPSFTGYAVVTIVSDIIVALLPIPVLLKINITRQKKLGLIGIFALGLFTTICSIMRYLQINEIQFGDHDSTMLVVWGVIEFNVGNMISSLPFLAPVFMRKVKEYRTERSKYGYGSNQGNSSRQTDGGQTHELGYIKNKKGTFASSSSPTSSRTDDAVAKQSTGIFKSVTYTVSVEDEEALIERRGQAQTPGQAFPREEPYTGATAH